MQMTWQTTPPQTPGWYWCCAIDGLLTVCEVGVQMFDSVTVKAGDLIVRDGAHVALVAGWSPFWMGPIDIPAMPGVDADDLDDTGLPPGAIEMTEPKDADND